MYIPPEERQAVIHSHQAPCIQMTRNGFVTVRVRDTIFLGLHREGTRAVARL